VKELMQTWQQFTDEIFVNDHGDYWSWKTNITGADEHYSNHWCGYNYNPDEFLLHGYLLWCIKQRAWCYQAFAHPSFGLLAKVEIPQGHHMPRTYEGQCKGKSNLLEATLAAYTDALQGEELIAKAKELRVEVKGVAA
jgi:hypothetical protein